MSKKTKRLHRRHITRKRNKKTRKHTKRRLYRKRRDILTVPGTQGIPLFSPPEKNSNQRIYVNKGNKQSGNMIPGMREM